MHLIEIRKDYALRRLRELKPVNPTLMHAMKALFHPVLWITVLAGAWALTAHWAVTEQSVSILIPLVFLIAGCSYLRTAIQADSRTLPPEVEIDPELQRAVDRLTRAGAPIRNAQREVIDQYVRAYYPHDRNARR